MSAEVIPLKKYYKQQERERVEQQIRDEIKRRGLSEERLLRDIMADGHELPQFPGGIDDLPFEELGDRPTVPTEPKR